MTRSQLVLAAALAAACAPRGERSEQQTAAAAVAATDTAHPWRKPGDKIDSILPMPEYLRRFRDGLTEPARLSGGGSNREELARRFLTAVSTRDTAAFAAMAVNRAEFAWLVFPLHKYRDSPYELDPAIFWLQLTAGSAKGLHRTLERYGGATLTLRSLRCTRDTLQVAAGSLKIWSGCTIRYQVGDSVESRALFGSVVERDGRSKLLSFANDF